MKSVLVPLDAPDTLLPIEDVHGFSAVMGRNTDYIGVLEVSGTIYESASSSLLGGSNSYHHNWIISRITEMESDAHNKGIILFVNTPGGSVYATDELYLKIKEYQQATGRPVYSYMASEAASGGYYISAPCDRIIANRNCWTGSIGVTVGTFFDLTGLLEKMGVKTVTITAGRNKAMGSSYIEMTKEQRAILQSLVDEAYDQFVGIVAAGRGLGDETVRELADGRIYTAKQALENNLIDAIGSFEEAKADMAERYKLTAPVKIIRYDENLTIFQEMMGQFSMLLDRNDGSSGKAEISSEFDELQALLSANQSFTVTYLATVRK